MAPSIESFLGKGSLSKMSALAKIIFMCLIFRKMRLRPTYAVTSHLIYVMRQRTHGFLGGLRPKMYICALCVVRILAVTYPMPEVPPV